MGQGRYLGLLWGERRKLSEEQFNLVDAALRELRTSYECSDPYLGVVIAATAGTSAVSLERQFGAVPIDALPAVLRGKLVEPTAKAQAAWNKARKKCTFLGEGELLIVSDYD